jgi:peptidoglycan hydrolase-like protein with peptidoglycan-binding domain
MAPTLSLIPKVTAGATALALALSLPALPARADDDLLRKLVVLGITAAVVKAAVDHNRRETSGPGGRDLVLSPAEISALQWRLARAGYYHGRIDGLAGPATRAAISRWQVASGHRATGWPDRAQLQALSRLGGTGYVSTRDYDPPRVFAPPPLSSQELRRLQDDLNFLGYGAGPADGYWGARSQAALDTWRRDLGAGAPRPGALPGPRDLALIAADAAALEDRLARELTYGLG